MVGNDVGELCEPETRERREHFALAFDWSRQDAIKSRDTIRGDDQQTVFRNGVNVANLATTDKLKIGKRSFDYGGNRNHYIILFFATQIKNLTSAIVRIHLEAVKNLREIKLIDLRSKRNARIVDLIVAENRSTTCGADSHHLATTSRRRLI